MEATYTSKSYDPNRQYARYVRLDGNGVYYFCEVGDDPKSEKRYDLRQGTVLERELPKSVAEAAQALQGFFPSYVDWPY